MKNMAVTCRQLFYGYYSCQWRRSGDAFSTSRTSKTETLFFALFTIIFLAAVIWLYSISIFENDSNEVNWFFFQQFHSWFNWFLLFIIISAVISAYIFPLYIAGLFNALRKSIHLCHKIFIFVCLFIIIAAFVAISIFYPEFWPLLSSSLEVTAFFLQLFATIIWTIFVIYVGLWIQHVESLLVRKCTYVAYWLVFVFFLTIPIWAPSPCVGSHTFTNPKPLIIGHRGAPTLAPENTILSYEKAIFNCNVSVLESDVRTSSDGVQFLLHDDDLRRTTNVEEVFPLRRDDPAETFSWNELQQLNAGEWYLNQDPFLTNRALSEADKAVIRQQKIPKLVDYIDLAAQNNRSVIFDLFRPPQENNFTESYVNLTLNTILNSSLPQENVIWIKTSDSIDLVRQFAPGFRIASPDLPNEDALASGIGIFNLIFTSVFNENLGLFNYSVIAYTINNNWAYTRAWCQGVWAVTTNQCLRFKNTNHPSWRLTQSQYLAIWITIDIVCVIAAIAIIYILCRKQTHTQASLSSLQSSFDDNLSHFTNTQQTLIL